MQAKSKEKQKEEELPEKVGEEIEKQEQEEQDPDKRLMAKCLKFLQQGRASNTTAQPKVSIHVLREYFFVFWMEKSVYIYHVYEFKVKMKVLYHIGTSYVCYFFQK